MPPLRPASRIASIAALSAATFVTAACGSSDSSTSTTTTSADRSDSTTTSEAGADSTTTTAPATLAEITVAGGEVAGGAARIEVAVGEPVTIRVTSDVAEEVHVHGYDLMADLTPGVAAEVSFTADIPGVFDVELEQAGLKIADLRVG